MTKDRDDDADADAAEWDFCNKKRNVGKTKLDDSLSLNLMAQFWRVVPYIVPYISPAMFGTWYCRYFAVQSTWKFYTWAQNMYISYYGIYHAKKLL